MGSEVVIENFESNLGAYVRSCSLQLVDLEESFGGFEVLFSIFDSLVTVDSIGSSAVAIEIGEKRFAEIKILLSGAFLATGDALFGDLTCLDNGGTVCQPCSLSESTVSHPPPPSSVAYSGATEAARPSPSSQRMKDLVQQRDKCNNQLNPINIYIIFNEIGFILFLILVQQPDKLRSYLFVAPNCGHTV
ncbi:hypothetical protein QTP88_005646 [Uroleucon formosanum]